MTWIYTRRTLFVLNLSRLFTVQLSMFSVIFSNSDMLSHLQVFVNNFFIFLFQFFRTDVLSFCDSFDILSNPIRFVKNFFHFLFRSDSVLCDSLIILSNRQPFVNNFFNSLFSYRQITCPDLFTVLFKKFCRRTFRSTAELILALFIFSVNTFSCFLINIFRSAYKHAKGIS